MKIILAIGLGSFIGGTLRYLISLFMKEKLLSSFPYGTLSVNIIGCFLIGIIFSLTEKNNIPSIWSLFLMSGILGGFTTFSAFSIETVNLLRDGQLIQATTYIVASVLLGILATYTGLMIHRLF